MGGLNTRRLLVPAVLSATAIVGCPAGDDDGGATSSTTTEDTSDTSTVTATSSSTMSSTATDSSGSSEPSTGDEASSGGSDSGTSTSSGGSSGETGGIPTCTDLPDEPSCAQETQCIFLPELGGCIRNCEMIEDLEVCEQSPGCVVFDNTCGYEPVE